MIPPNDLLNILPSMQIKDLKANPKNPRRMSADALNSLKASVAEFGDLSGFVYNRRSKRLVGGHQKQKVVPPKSQIKIEQKYETPTACRTVAEGYVLINGERWKYREVDAEPEWEAAAMIAANKHSGDWDNDLLRVVLSEVKNVSLTGFSNIELRELNIQINPLTLGAETPEGDEPWIDTEEVGEELSDEDYVKNTPETQEQIDTEKLPSTVNDSHSAFDSIDEDTTVKGKRFVVIVDCKDQVMKDAMKDLLRPIVEKAGAKIF